MERSIKERMMVYVDEHNARVDARLAYLVRTLDHTKDPALRTKIMRAYDQVEHEHIRMCEQDAQAIIADLNLQLVGKLPTLSLTVLLQVSDAIRRRA